MKVKCRHLRVDSRVALKAGVKLDDSNYLDPVLFQIHSGVAAHVAEPLDYRSFVLKHQSNMRDHTQMQII